MCNKMKTTEAPFVHVDDDADFGGVWAGYHRRYASPVAQVQAWWTGVQRLSDRLDAWCDESIVHLMITLVVGSYLTVGAVIAAYMMIF